jgi:hypothetical protein
MRRLTASDLLDLWERGLEQSPVHRALEMLAATLPESRDTLDRLPVGRRDWMLLQLHEQTFGPRVNAVTVCSSCGERIELDFDVAAVRADAPESRPEVEMILNQYSMRLRAPDSLDLLLTCQTNAEEAEWALLERCVIGSQRAGVPLPPRELPPEIVDAAVARIAEMDPQADTQLAVNCAQCGTHNRVPFDIGAFLWREIEDFAVRIMREVQALASAYGWDERRILEMSPVRRRCYLEMLSA